MMARSLTLVRPRRISPSLAHLFRINTLLFVANASTGLVNYLFHVVVGHMLTPGDYGTVAALINVSYVTVLIPTTIVLTLFTRAAAALSTRDQMGELRDMWAKLTLWLLILGGVATLVFSLGLSGPVAGFLQIPSGGRAVALLGLLFLIGFASPVNQGVLQGMQRFGWLSLMIATGPLLRVLLAAVFIALGGGVDGAVLGLAAATLLPYALSFWPVWPEMHREQRRPIALRPWLGYSTVVAVATATTVLLYNLDTILAKHFLSAVEAGRYAALANTGKIVFFIGGSVVIVMFPKVAAAHARGERHDHLLWFSLGATLVLSLLVVAVFAAAPGLVLAHMFGASYVAVRGDLPWYGLAMLLFALAGVFTQYFLSLDDRRFLWILVACCVGQAGALWLWHSGVTQMVHVMVASMALLLVGLAAYYATVIRRAETRIEAGARDYPAQRQTG
jgi:O-antigen/teichoic acid export membrane protein